MTEQGGAFTPPPGPLAAPPSKRRFVVVMAFFAALFLASVAGFFLTWDREDVRTATIGGGTGVDRVTPGPPTRTVSPPSATPTGPVPKPVTYRGSGDDVVQIRKPEPGQLALVYLKGNAAGETFTVSALDRNGTKIGLLVATFSPYEGVRPIDAVGSFLQTAALEIQAKGPWTVQVRSARSAPVFTGKTSGRGDSVVRYLGDGGVATLKGGTANKQFTVTTHVGGFPRLLVAGIGPYSGSKPWPRGDVLVEVQSTGAWSIAVR